MGTSGSQTLTIIGPKRDIDIIETYFDFHYGGGGGETLAPTGYAELLMIYQIYNRLCKTDPKKSYEFFKTHSEQYDNLLTTMGGAIFKELLTSNLPLNMEDRLTLSNHTLLYQSHNRISSNEICIGHSFQNYPTISFVNCLAEMFPNCFFENECSDEDGDNELDIFTHIGSQFTHLYFCWSDPYSWTPVGPIERMGLRSTNHKGIIKKDERHLRNFEDCDEKCGCITLGNPKCLLEDPSRIYNLWISVGDYYGIDEYNLEIVEPHRLKQLEQTYNEFEETMVQICNYFTTKGATLHLPKSETLDTELFKLAPILAIRKLLRDVNKRVYVFRCQIKGVKPGKLIAVLCRKYKASFWCCYNDTQNIIQGTFNNCTCHHYPRPHELSFMYHS